MRRRQVTPVFVVGQSFVVVRKQSENDGDFRVAELGPSLPPVDCLWRGKILRAEMAGVLFSQADIESANVSDPEWIGGPHMQSGHE
jgi:hypothetical protein